MTALEQEFVRKLISYCVRQSGFTDLQLWMAEHGQEFDLDGANPNRMFIDAVEDQMAAFMRGYMTEGELRSRLEILLDEHVEPQELEVGR
jgi:hypothetical protein